MKKRSLSLLLALLMVLSLIVPGTAAFADSVDVQTPVSAESTQLKWAKKLGTGWMNAPSVPTVADDGVIVMLGKTINKLNFDDGEIIASGEMSASPSYGYTPCIIAGDSVIAPLGGGTLQAFDAKTLESRWVYIDELKGQALSPILYADGKLYTGFWNGEEKNANFVCVDVKTGSLDWSYTVKGGFYWAGAVAVGDYIFVGTDDGAKGSEGDGTLLAFKNSYAENEEVKPVSSAVLTGCGDVRSSLAYSDGKVYFTTKGGYLCSAAVDEKTGEISDLKTVPFGAQSTSTPVIYGDHIYFGAGSGISDSGSTGNFVIADKETLKVENYVALKGYPQCEMLLSTAYLESTGYLYFYSTYNMTPGGVSLIKVKADDISDTELVELYDAEGYEQYCIASVVTDKDGNLYYKNDSGCVFCLAQCMSADVSVSVSDKGGIELSHAEVTAYDRNADGKIDIDEVLYAAHDEYYDGGAAAGYASADSEYGAYITKLWGDESGNFGYYVNDKMSMGLSDEVSEGDHVYAYITANAYPNNDAYAFFDTYELPAAAGGSVTVKLNYQSGYDESYNPVFSGFDKAELTAYANGEKAEGFTYKSTGNGAYELSFDRAGEYTVAAAAENNAIVPAVCKIKVIPQPGFADVSEASYYYDAVAWGSSESIVRGYSSTVFAPDDACTRAQIVTFLYRYAGCPAVSGECKFNDVTDKNYKDAIIWASENGIALGYSDTVFAPDDTCTRAQAVTFMHRFMGTNSYDHDRSFTDITGGEYYYEAVMWAAGCDIAKGFPDGSFRPNDDCTRAQIVTLIYRAAA